MLPSNTSGRNSEVKRFPFPKRKTPKHISPLCDLRLSVSMDMREEVLDILEKVWIKLQDLPQASPLELGAFFVLILFVATFLFMIALSCVHCCCCGKPKYQAARVQPLETMLG
ncbi:small integral membrane protein 5 [Thunnus albacares]|uniref:small integral membrane protein 5 n=2 Tax=Thunnus TaxID=8234 RepID=UPI001CF69043|nr:small integral membrane protein 5 [Thunnus albacares]XP_044193678.1 small integral membrane protein 5 [Thunnus albacares]